MEAVEHMEGQHHTITEFHYDDYHTPIGDIFPSIPDNAIAAITPHSRHVPEDKPNAEQASHPTHLEGFSDLSFNSIARALGA